MRNYLGGLTHPFVPYDKKLSVLVLTLVTVGFPYVLYVKLL